MRPATVKDFGTWFRLVGSAPPSPPRRPALIRDALGGFAPVGETPLPLARDLFSPNQLAALIEAETMLREAEPEYAGDKTVHCWACGSGTGYRNHIPPGWVKRAVRFSGQHFVEVYCPTCFAEWGWPALTEWEEAAD